jgi:alkyldihydroxyacetonephosphate synthase
MTDEDARQGDWTGWGAGPPLPPAALTFLGRRLGGRLPVRGRAALDSVPVPPSRLPAPAGGRLVAALGAAQVHTDPESRLRHSGGHSYTDLIRRRVGTVAVPDAVLTPGTPREVQAVLEICADERVAVVPFGGGTSVVGGVAPATGGFDSVVTVDLHQLDRVITVDHYSSCVTVQAGMRAPALEAALRAEGLTLGHFPQSFERASVGGFVATRSAGQASTGYGRIDDLLTGLRLATPAGELVLPALPGSAAGPDLRRLVLGSEGVLGIVTEVTLRVHRRPAVRRYVGWMLPSWTAGLAAAHEIAQDGYPPDIVRVSDEDETAVGLALSSAGGGARRALTGYLRLRRRARGCLVIVGFEGGTDDVDWRERRTTTLLRRHGGVRLGRRVGASWEHSRYAGPYVRDHLLDHGLLAETLETAALWSHLPALYAEVRTALATALTDDGPPPLVGCHVSHLYATGGSLYFTVLARQSDDPVGQWAAAKQAAGDAIVRAGGTITHHHAVGTDHRRWLSAETGDLGVAAVKAVKDRWDPVGVMNPGKLLPSAT